MAIEPRGTYYPGCTVVFYKSQQLIFRSPIKAGNRGVERSVEKHAAAYVGHDILEGNEMQFSYHSVGLGLPENVHLKDYIRAQSSRRNKVIMMNIPGGLVRVPCSLEVHHRLLDVDFF